MLISILISLNTDFDSLFGYGSILKVSVSITPIFAYPLSIQSCIKSIQKVRLVRWRRNCDNFTTELSLLIVFTICDADTEL